MTKTKFQEIDPILLPWAERHTLYVSTEYKDEEVRSISVVNEFADVYMIYVTVKTNKRHYRGQVSTFDMILLNVET